MRIAIQTMGTRGDTQPYIALAKGLMANGHAVQLAAPKQFEAMVRDHGVDFFGLSAEFLALLDSPEGKAAVAGGQGFSSGLKLIKQARPLMRQLLEEEWAAVKGFGAELILGHPKSLATPHVAEALGIPHMLACPLPGFTPTSAFPTPLLPFASVGPLNRISHGLAMNGGRMLFGRELREWRVRSLGLAPKAKLPPLSGTLYAYSPAVLPKPADWSADVAVTGYWFLDEPGWQPDADLAAFLAAGNAPVYVGFGSMPGIDPQRMTQMVVEALARSGKRGLLATGGGALAATALPAHVHLISAAPHDRLLPLASAAIHHGGAGTTGASLRAGLPTTICPFFGDQPFWGRRMVKLGTGPKPLDRKTLTVEAIVAAITAMDDPGMRARAAAIGEAIRAERGVDAAVAFIEQRTRRA
jgi:sterol 3beta-glucosyltransferase